MCGLPCQLTGFGKLALRRTAYLLPEPPSLCFVLFCPYPIAKPYSASVYEVKTQGLPLSELRYILRVTLVNLFFCKGERLEPQGFLRSVPDKFKKNSVTYCHKTICFISHRNINWNQRNFKGYSFRGINAGITNIIKQNPWFPVFKDHSPVHPW